MRSTDVTTGLTSVFGIRGTTIHLLPFSHQFASPSLKPALKKAKALGKAVAAPKPAPSGCTGPHILKLGTSWR